MFIVTWACSTSLTLFPQVVRHLFKTMWNIVGYAFLPPLTWIWGHSTIGAIVEINRDHPNENKQRLWSQNFLWQGSWPASLRLAQTQAGREAGERLSRKGKLFRGALMEAVGLGKLRRRLEMGRPMHLVREAYWRSFSARSRSCVLNFLKSCIFENVFLLSFFVNIVQSKEFFGHIPPPAVSYVVSILSSDTSELQYFWRFFPIIGNVLPLSGCSQDICLSLSLSLFIYIQQAMSQSWFSLLLFSGTLWIFSIYIISGEFSSSTYINIFWFICLVFLLRKTDYVCVGYLSSVFHN